MKNRFILAVMGICVVMSVQAKNTVVQGFHAAGGSGSSSWHAVVKNGHMSLQTAGDKANYTKIPIQRSAYAKGVEFIGNTPHGEVTLNIRGQRCRSSKGRINEFTARLYYRDQVLKGCAVRLD